MANQKHCQEVYDFLKGHPENHDQWGWAHSSGPLHRRPWEARLRDQGGFVQLKVSEDLRTATAPPLPDNTTVCTAGAAAYVSGVLAFQRNPKTGLTDRSWRSARGPMHIGRKYLELTRQEAKALFLHCGNRDIALEMLKAGAEGRPMIAIHAERYPSYYNN